MVDDRPKCFVPFTNTASGTPYLVEISSISRDNHEIAKTEPQRVTYNPTSVSNIWEKPANPYIPNEQTVLPTDYKKWDAPPKVDLPTGEITTCVSVLASALKIEDEPQRGCDADCNEDCTECAKEWQDWKDQMWAEAVIEPQTEKKGE